MAIKDEDITKYKYMNQLSHLKDDEMSPLTYLSVCMLGFASGTTLDMGDFVIMRRNERYVAIAEKDLLNGRGDGTLGSIIRLFLQDGCKPQMIYFNSYSFIEHVCQKLFGEMHLTDKESIDNFVVGLNNGSAPENALGQLYSSYKVMKVC